MIILKEVELYILKLYYVIMLQENIKNRSVLWNEVERIEKGKSFTACS